MLSTPTGLRPGGQRTTHLRSPPATTPLGLMALAPPGPRVVPLVQPWAWLHNRFAVEAAHATLGWKCRKLSDSLACMPHSLSAVYIHLVFSTKNREPAFRDQQLRQEMHAYLGGVSKQLECPPLLVGGVEDPVHILARFGRTITQATWVKELKRVSNSTPDTQAFSAAGAGAGTGAGAGACAGACAALPSFSLTSVAPLPRRLRR